MKPGHHGHVILLLPDLFQVHSMSLNLFLKALHTIKYGFMRSYLRHDAMGTSYGISDEVFVSLVSYIYIHL